MEMRFDNQVAIVTGAGNGLGRAYALLLGERGAKVVVNDLGVSKKGDGEDSRPADNVVNEIRAAGGIAVSDYHSVEDGAAIVQTALENFGRIDIVVNNAGILRDRSFARMSDQDWDLVHAVHLRGTFQVTRAAFPHLKKQKFGRIIVTSSAAGIYGNFGQANYSAAKLGLHGFCQTVAREGARSNIYCNTIAPMGGTRLTEGIIPPDLFEQLKPELIAPLVAWLCHKDCQENGSLFEAAAGWFGKYRFERTRGAVLRGSLNELVTPEAVRDNWESVTSFEVGAHHPESTEESVGHLNNVLEELRERDERIAANSNLHGPAAAIGFTQPSLPFTYTAKDVILYALGVGVSTKDEDHLQYLYEGSDNFSALPTFGIILAQSCTFMGPLLAGGIPNYSLDLSKVLHGEQYVEIHKAIPATGATVHTSLEVEEMLDKGSGALMVLKSVTRDEEGDVLATNQWCIFIVGDGNFGGKRSSDVVVPLAATPQRSPDAIVERQTSVDQAALYRLSGDLNPLHIDPSFAAMGGFSQPILHGLCSVGFAVKAVVDTYCPGQPTSVKAVKVRFSKPVLPGQTLVTSMWQDGSRIYFTCSVKETGKECLTGAYVDLLSSPDATTKAPSQGANPAVAELFQGIADKIVAGGPDLVKKVKACFVFAVSEGGKVSETWTVDMKSPPGAVYPGPPKAGPGDVTLTVESSDLISIAKGALNPQKAFMSDKLKVKGNIMATQKLKDIFGTQQSKV